MKQQVRIYDLEKIKYNSIDSLTLCTKICLNVCCFVLLLLLLLLLL